MKTEQPEDWRERCKTCPISGTCILKDIVSYCSGVIDVKPVLSMIMEDER